MLPQQMLAVEITAPGGPEMLRLCHRPLPQIAADEVLIKVAAAGVNRADVMQRQGLYPPPAGASDIPGLEVAGTVVAVGANAPGLAVGDSVCALLSGGGYAEYCAAAALLCLPVPKGLSLIQAAAVPETFFTVWSNVFDRARLQPHETLLVHGGASGIGTTAIQMARLWGAEVYTTAGSIDKCRFCERLGAKVAIPYRDEDFVARINALTDGRGVDVILDIVGGDYLQRNLNCLATNGRLLQIALQHGPKTQINLLPIMLKRLTLTGSTLRSRSLKEKAVIADALYNQVWPTLASAQIQPVIDCNYPLADAASAHRLMEQSGHMGKIVLTML